MQVFVKDERIHVGQRFSVSCQRTLRVPNDDRLYPLPPGLGSLPISRVEDYRSRLPAKWAQEHAFFIPLYQREALWLGFDGVSWKPNAVKVGVGRVNAVSGNAWDENLHHNPQDYLVCPDQPWLDGINAGQGFVRQFVAMPLGLGYTVEAQVAEAEEYGGVQLLVFEPKPGRFPDQPPPSEEVLEPAQMMMPSIEMGLAAGGSIRQKIYPDPYGVDTWDQDDNQEVFIYIVNSDQYKEITGSAPPQTPISAQTYTDYGLPWFDLYDESRSNLAASPTLSRVKSVGAKDPESGPGAYDKEPSVEVPETQVKKLHLPKAGKKLRERKNH